jgi:heptose I phosphotransferase
MTPTSSTRSQAPSFWRRLLRGSRVLRQAADWPHFAGEDWPDRILTETVTDLLHEKQGRAIARWTLTNGGEKLIVFLKRHYKLPWLDGLLATLFPGSARSPGLQEWEHLEWAKAAGFPVPRAVAAGQFTGRFGKLQGFIAIEELTGQLPLHLAVPLAAESLSPADFANWKRGLIAELSRIARELHRRSVFHKDLYFCHFYIPETLTREVPKSWVNRAVMIDLHRMSRHSLLGTWFQIKDLAQFLYSSEVPGVTARDRLRFWKRYRELWPGRAPGRWMELFIRWKWNLYRRHAARKQQRKVT